MPTIAENLQRLVNAKDAIATAITTKGGTVGQNDGLEDFATDIDTIPTGDGGEISLTFTSTYSDKVPQIYGNSFTQYIKSATVRDGVTELANSAFYNCKNMTSVTLPDSITTLGVSVFYECRALLSVDLPPNITTIPESAFYNCFALTGITIPEGVTSIKSLAFYECDSLDTVVIPSTVTTISSNAFEYAHVNKMIINKPEGSISGAPWQGGVDELIWTG